MEHKSPHAWGISPEAARRTQEHFQEQIILEGLPLPVKTIAGADAAYAGGLAYGAVVVLSFPELELLEQRLVVRKVSFPYLPGLLSFREGPVLLDCFSALRSEPGVLIFDGQGIAHPRGFGLASHLGLLLGRSAIGCAKKRLFGQAAEPGRARGSWTPLLDSEGRERGCVLRTRENVRPLFVSPGYKISFEQSREVILSVSPRFRIPEPLRLAHRAATAWANAAKAREALSAF